jgi:hypothetical protein
VMTPSETLAISRAIERLLITLFCGMSVYLGYRLFRLGIVEHQKGSVDSFGWKVKLDSVGPGIFFALFGVIGLTVGTLHSFTFDGDGSSASGGSVSSLGSFDNSQVRSEVKALNAAIDSKDINCDVLKGDLERGNDTLKLLRQDLLLTVFAPEDLNDWSQNQELWRRGQITDRARAKKFFDISSYMDAKD